MRGIHNLSLGAHELLSSHKPKEINIQSGINPISSYTVTPGLNLIHNTEENKQTNKLQEGQTAKEGEKSGMGNPAGSFPDVLNIS